MFDFDQNEKYSMGTKKSLVVTDSVPKPLVIGNEIPPQLHIFYWFYEIWMTMQTIFLMKFFPKVNIYIIVTVNVTYVNDVL